MKFLALLIGLTTIAAQNNTSSATCSNSCNGDSMCQAMCQSSQELRNKISNCTQSNQSHWTECLGQAIGLNNTQSQIYSQMALKQAPCTSQLQQISSKCKSNCTEKDPSCILDCMKQSNFNPQQCIADLAHVNISTVQSAQSCALSCSMQNGIQTFFACAVDCQESVLKGLGVNTNANNNTSTSTSTSTKTNSNTSTSTSSRTASSQSWTYHKIQLTTGLLLPTALTLIFGLL